jgi:hypothetical protein
MCQVLFDIIKTGDVSIDHVQNDIVCKFDKQPSEPAKPIPSKPPTGDPNGAIDPPPPVSEMTFFDFVQRYKYEFFAITILLVVLLVVVTRL